MGNERMSELILQTGAIKEEADYLAPDGSEIRLLPTMKVREQYHENFRFQPIQSSQSEN